MRVCTVTVCALPESGIRSSLGSFCIVSPSFHYHHFHTFFNPPAGLSLKRRERERELSDRTQAHRDVLAKSAVKDMREKSAMDGASEELERRSRYLSSLIERTKLKGDANHEKEVKKEKVQEKRGDDGGDGEKYGDDLKDMESIRIRAADMPRELQRRAFRCARETLGGMPKLDSKRLALALKKEFDSSYGPAWHCIVGMSFGSYVTHSLGGFLYFSIGKVYILLFRTAVEPLLDHQQP